METQIDPEVIAANFRVEEIEPAKKDVIVVPLNEDAIKSSALGLHAFIALDKLGMYGFTPDIVQGFMFYDVFPTVYKHKNKLLVLRKDIFGLVEIMLSNAIALYHEVDENAKALEYAKANATEIRAKLEEVIAEKGEG